MQTSDPVNPGSQEKLTSILCIVVFVLMILVVIAQAVVFILRSQTSGADSPEGVTAQYFETIPIITSDGSRLYIDTEPQTEQGKTLYNLLKDTWTYEIQGTEENGNETKVSVNITCPDLSRMPEPVSGHMQEEIHTMMAAASEKSEIYNSDNTYREEVLQSAYDKALPQSCVSAPMITVNVTMILQRDFLKWELTNPAQPDNSLDTSAQQLMQTSKSLVPYMTWTYVIEDNDSVPVPDPQAYTETTDPAVISALLETTYAKALINGQTLVWNPEIDFFEGTTITCYLDESLLVIQWQQEEQGTLGTFAEVIIADGSQLRRKIAGDTYGDMNFRTCSAFAAETNAVLAVGGDFYNHGRNCGIVVYDKTIYRLDYSTCDVCYITDKGDMLFSYRNQFSEESEVQSFIEENGILWSLCFGPVLIDNNGGNQTPAEYPWGEINDYYARSSLGLLGERHYLTMNLNCGTGDADGYVTLREAADSMVARGCIKAYTLDGGQTATTVVNGVLKNPVQFGKEKEISDIIFFASAVPRQ